GPTRSESAMAAEKRGPKPTVNRTAGDDKEGSGPSGGNAHGGAGERVTPRRRGTRTACAGSPLDPRPQRRADRDVVRGEPAAVPPRGPVDRVHPPRRRDRDDAPGLPGGPRRREPAQDVGRRVVGRDDRRPVPAATGGPPRPVPA